MEPRCRVVRCPREAGELEHGREGLTLERRGSPTDSEGAVADADETSALHEGSQLPFGGAGSEELGGGDDAVRLFGGGGAGLNFIKLRYPDGSEVVPKNKDLITGVPKGTIYHQVAGGGGGYGDPKRRDRKVLAEEVRNGVVTPEAARVHYGYEPGKV